MAKVSSTRFLVCVTVMFQNPADGSCADRAHVKGSMVVISIGAFVKETYAN